MLKCLALCVLALGGLPGEPLFLRAHDALRAGEYQATASQFAACGEQDRALAPYARIYAARALAASEGAGTAAALCQSVLEQYPNGPWRAMADADLARYHRDQGQLAAASAGYTELLRISPRPWWMDDYVWEAAECLAAQPGREGEAFALYREIVLGWDLVRPRRDAAALLIKSENPADRAVAILGLMRSFGDSTAKKALPDAGLVVFDAHGAPLGFDALEASPPPLDGLAKANEGNLWYPVWLRHRVRAEAAAGRLRNALNAAEELVSAYPEARDAGDVLWWLASYLEGKKEEAQADAVYERLVRACPTHFKADDALMRLAERQTRRGEGRQAESTYARLVKDFPESRFVSLAHTNTAELRTKRGDLKGARAALEAAGAGPLGDFNAHRALALLDDTATPRLAITMGGHDPWLAVRTVPGAPPAMPPDCDALQRVRFFGRHGIEAGEWEAMHLCREHAGTEGAAGWYRALAEAGYAHSTWQFARASKEMTPRLDYPLAYWPEVRAMADEYKLDPFLILAVARQESTFRAAIGSHAGARGVMQMMPKTANWLVTKDESIQKKYAAHLDSPENSLRLGAYYLRMMLDRSGGNLVYALASYNGGPGNCDKWRKRYGGDNMDRFLDTITFSETRDYVRRVMGNLAAYHALYDATVERTGVSFAQRKDVPSGASS